MSTSPTPFRFFTMTALTAVLTLATAGAKDLQKLEGCTLVPHTGNDGDSFLVQVATNTYMFRLYFVDCPETSSQNETDARRMRSQTRYFGVDSHRETLAFGRKGTERTRELLSEPFTVHTSFSRAPGRSRKPRFYAFVTTGAGSDLGKQLVTEGLARAFGLSHACPNGTPGREHGARLEDIEAGGMLQRRGIWGASRVETLVEGRKREREDIKELRDIFENPFMENRWLEPVDLNTASIGQLCELPGIGPVTANSIIAGRPFKETGDIRDVPGIGDILYQALQPHIKVGE